MNTIIQENLSKVLERVNCAARKAGRDPSAIKIVVASKKQSAQAMNDLKACFEAAGRKVIYGESYLQDFKSKENSLIKPYELHIIGPLQSNKVKEAVKLSDCIESAHSIKILDEINRAADGAGKVQRIFIQVNISLDEAKSGFMPTDLKAAIDHISKNLSSLKLEGLMTITRFYENREDARRDFRAMKELAGTIDRPLELSMGMSDDFDIAIEEGASIVRIGTALFGERK